MIDPSVFKALSLCVALYLTSGYVARLAVIMSPHEFVVHGKSVTVTRPYRAALALAWAVFLYLSLT